jgi:hypothetical protein
MCGTRVASTGIVVGGQFHGLGSAIPVADIGGKKQLPCFCKTGWSSSTSVRLVTKITKKRQLISDYLVITLVSFQSTVTQTHAISKALENV